MTQPSRNDSKKAVFKYIPDTPQAPFDTKFHTRGSDGIYTYHVDARWLKNVDELKEFAKTCPGRIIAWDNETTGLTYMDDHIVGFSLSLDDMSGIYVPIRHRIKTGETITKIPELDIDGVQKLTKAKRPKMEKVISIQSEENPKNLNPKECLDILYDILVNAKTVLIHNAEYDLVMLKSEGYDISKITFFDTMTLTYLQDPEATGINGLKGAEKHYLGRYRKDLKEVAGNETYFRYLEPEDGYEYAVFDTANTYGLFKKLFPLVQRCLNDSKDTISLDGKKYNVLQKDNKLIKCWANYYAHAPINIDKEVALIYKKQIKDSLLDIREEIYNYFGLGPFNINANALDFKKAMKLKNIVTGGFTKTGNASFGEEGITIFSRAVRNLKLILKNMKELDFRSSYLDLRKNKLALMLEQIIVTYGTDYFQTVKGPNSLKILPKGEDKTLDKEEFTELLKVMLEEEEKKLHILNKIKENSSLTKAVNSYIDKLSKVDTCRMRYKLFGTKSGRFASGNGSRKDTSNKNRYYIDLNAQNLTKPESAFYKAYRSEEEGNILGWMFELVSEEYAKANRDTEYIVEGFSPELNIRNAVIAPKGKYILSCDYSSQEYLLLALLSLDSKMLQNFLDGIDPHTATAYGVWGKENYSKEKRKLAKGVNFALNYGGTAFTISKNLDIPLDEAKEIEARYNAAFFECIQWKNNQISKMYKNGGIVYTMFGRPRKLGSYIRISQSLVDEDPKASWVMQSAAERRVCSHIIQGSAGDIMRMVLIQLYDKIFKHPELEADCSFISTIHDEVNTAVTKSKAIEYARLMEDTMRFQLPTWCLPIRCTIGLGNRWGEVFDFEWIDNSRTELIPKRYK